MIEEKVLIDLGLSQIEAKIYLACLGLGQDTVLNIAKKAEIKRPTCYVALDNLCQKGFMIKIEKQNTTLFAAENPRIILNQYKEKIANFTELLPYFETQSNKGPKPKIRYYEGKAELLSVYLKIIHPSSEMYFFGTDIGKLMATFPTLIDDYEKKIYAEKKIYQEIISNDINAKAYLDKYGSKRPIKIMPADLPVCADVAITENKLFIVSLNNLFGVLIESEDLAKTFKNFFLLAWKSAE